MTGTQKHAPNRTKAGASDTLSQGPTNLSRLADPGSALIAEIARTVAAQLADALLPELSACIESALAHRPRLVGRPEMARLLGCSTATFDKLRREPGFPELRIVDSPRFDPDAVLEWLAARDQGVTHG